MGREKSNAKAVQWAALLVKEYQDDQEGKVREVAEKGGVLQDLVEMRSFWKILKIEMT